MSDSNQDGKERTIYALGMTAKDGCFIDFPQNPSAIVISPKEGAVMFRVPPGVIPGEAVIGFAFEQENQQLNVRYRDSTNEERTIVFGTFADPVSAKAWVDRVSMIYKR